MDQGIYVDMMTFASGFRHLVRRTRPETDWPGLLTLVSAAVWLAVMLAADGLMGGAVLATLQGTSIDELTPGHRSRAPPASVYIFMKIVRSVLTGMISILVILIAERGPTRPVSERTARS